MPACRACTTSMRYLFQVVTHDAIAIGGDGTGWIFVCPTCRDATFLWQR